MQPDEYDVIIVGGGPAGGSAAYFLGEAGQRVLVLEKHRLPRYKACGGGLSPRFLKEQFPFSFEPISQTEVHAFSYAFLGQMVTIPLRRGLVSMVMRDQLDAFILSKARAEVIQGAAVQKVTELADRVVVETQDGRSFSGRYVIGADGANSMVARSLGLRRKRQLIAAIEAEVPAAPEIAQQFGHQPVFIFGEIRQGYLWIFPKEDHLSVGAAGLHPKPGVLQATLRRVMAQYGISLDNVPLHGHPIPLYSRHERIATARTLLVGDAAGLVDPLSGEGIRYAIKSGRLAAEAILSGHPERYEGRVFRSIGLNHTLALLEALIFFTFEDLCLILGAPNPFTTQAIVEMLADHRSTTAVMTWSILSLPVFVAIEIFAALAGLWDKTYRKRVRALIYPKDIDWYSMTG